MPIHPDVRIGHVHLKVADLDRALGFYRDVLGFRADAALRARRRVPVGRRLPPSHRAEHLGKPRRVAAAARHDRPVSHRRSCIPTRAELADALRRVLACGHPARRRRGPRRQRGALPAGSGRERRGAVLGSASRRSGRALPTASCDVHAPPGYRGLLREGGAASRSLSDPVRATL